jgi:peptidoglycan/xylan/chitin deacetylase (PgdA/CDA1 family)
MRRRRAVLLLTPFCLLALAGPAHAAASTIVSLTFDDGTATQYQAGQLLADHGMKGTFYLNSARVGTGDYYMTWANVQQLAAAGNEIGGHTAHHVNLPKTDATEAQREICQDRVNLLGKGFDVRNFAYPYGAYDTSTEQAVQDCGYNSARTSTPKTSESIPPPDPYAIREATGSGDLATLKNAVMAAEQSGGGWVPIVFHQICNACDSSWILPSDLKAFLDWLQPRAANGTVVRTVQEVLGGPLRPAVQPPPPPPAPNGFNAIKNSSLETDADGDRVPDCFSYDTFGSNTYSWSRTSDAHSGSFAERLDITNHQSGDGKLVMTSDLGFCTPTVTPGHRYRLTTWYKSTGPVSFATFNRDTLGAFAFWTSSPTFPASSTWTQASWVTPVVPSGVTGLTFGLALNANGSLTVDDLGMDDASPTGSADRTPPTVSLTAPAPNSTVSGSVPITATATDNVAIDHVDFLVDGATVGTRSATPYTFSWNARSVANGTHTIAARAFDTSGNAATTAAITVRVSNSVANVLQNPSLETASGSTPTCWTLGGYGTNTFAWTRTTDAHTGGFAEKLDVTGLSSGDRKLVVTQSGTTCPVAGTPGHSYAVGAWYKSPNDPNLTGSRPVLFAYYLNGSGSWVYWAQSPPLPASATWTQGTWNTPSLPADATAVSVGLGLQMTGTVTMDDFSLTDNAPPPDTTPPTSAITCNEGDDAGGCTGGYYRDTVQVSLSAADDEFGSGVASIRYTTDGSDPTPTNGTTYMGPFAVTAPGATVKWRAYDRAGNAEAVHTRTIRIDPTAPTSTISCDGGACGDGFYGAALSVTLDATDAGGSGVREIRYTTDGSDPTATSGRTYLGAFSLAATATVKWRAFDNAGNAEPVRSRLIRIDSLPPTSTITCDGSPCTGATYPSAVSVGLSATDDVGGSGVSMIRYTTDGTDPTATTGTVYVSPFPFTVDATTTIRYRAIDQAGNLEPVNTQVITIKSAPAATVTLTNPADGATVSGTVDLTAATSDASIASVAFEVDGTQVGTATRPPLATTWDSSTVPDGTHTITVLGYGSDGAVLDTDAATVTVSNTAADTIPPTSAIRCNQLPCSANAYNSAVSVSLSATDDPGGSGVREIRYTTDGSDPTSTYGTVYSGTFSVTANTLIKFRASDNAGNLEPVRSQQIEVDGIAPTSSVFCGGSPCESTYYDQPVAVSLAASDAGGSGVARIVYTTDGSTPTETDGSVFDTAFTLRATTTVKYRAFDNAGNAEPVNAALIKVDVTPPATTIACDGGSCTGPFRPGVAVTLDATDADSGVAAIRYTTDGTDPTATTGKRYTAPFTLSASATVRYLSIDNVGNAEAVRSQPVRVDGTAPTVSVTSPGAGATLGGPVTLVAAASDDVAVDHVDFLVDGQQVGRASSTPYTLAWDSTTVGDGPHSITARAVDTAGNSATSSSVAVTTANTNLLQNPSLETGSGSAPACWTLTGYGTNTFSWTRTSDAHTGSFAETLNLTSLTSGDRKMVSTQDTGACAPSAIPGKAYTVSTWYKGPNGPVLFAYYRNSAGSWVYWAQSPIFPASASWTQRSWKTPALPAGATAISVGPGLQQVGSVTMDDLGLFLAG